MGQQEPNKNYETQLVALGRVLQTLQENENADVLIETVVSFLKTEFSYSLIWLGLYDRLEHRLVGKGGVVPKGDATFLKQRFSLNSGDLLEQVVIQQRSIGVPDLRAESRAGEWREAAVKFGIQGTLLFPLLCKDRCVGIAMLGSHLWGTTPRTLEKTLLSMLFGGLGSALYQLEVVWQHAAVKHADKPMFQLLDLLQQVDGVEKRLEVVVQVSHDFIAPTRTNLYWYSPDRRYFWQRLGHKQAARKLRDTENSAPGLSVSEVGDFYLALAAGQIVAIGTGRSSLKAEVTGLLLAQFRARSLLAAPIQMKGEMLGFLVVEDNEARIWEETEQNYIRAAAQTIALVSGKEDMEGTLQQTQKNANLIAEVAGAIGADAEPQAALKQCAELILDRLGVERFLVLQQEKNTLKPIDDEKTVFQTAAFKVDNYKILYQHQSPKKSALRNPLEALTNAEEQLLEKNAALVIEDWKKEQRLLKWREPLMQVGARSLLVSRIGSKCDRLLVISQGTPRTWQQSELKVVGIVSQQIGLLLHNLQMQTNIQLVSVAEKTLQSGLTNLLAAPPDPAQFERSWLEYLAKLLECPLVALLGWMPQKPNVRTVNSAFVQATVATNEQFALPAEFSIPLIDPLIQETLTSSGILCRNIAELTLGTRRLLSNTSIGTLMVIALQSTPATPPTGIILLADRAERQWPKHLFVALENLMREFAALRAFRRLNTNLSYDVKNLEQLNWYKHRSLELVHYGISTNVSRLLSDYKNQGQLSPDESLRQMRSSQILHQVEHTLTSLNPLLNDEQWQLQTSPAPTTLESLLKRSLRRVESLYNQRKLSLQIKNTTPSIYGDRLKLECLLFELLLTAAYRAQPGSRIDLWCRPLNGNNENQSPSQSLVEVLVTESDRNRPNSAPREKGSAAEADTDAIISSSSSPLNQQLSQNMRICQRLVRSWGGELQFYQLGNGRFASRMILKSEANPQ